jgi:hypothetical protein
VIEDGSTSVLRVAGASLLLLVQQRGRVASPKAKAPAVRAADASGAQDGERFPSLRVELLRCAEQGEILANTPRPVTFENDFFQGKMLFLLRNEPLAGPYVHMFEGKNRLFNIQVQGRFKVPVINPYFGGEITNKMELGLLAKGMARTILSFIRALIPEMHHSFGDDEGIELPHITVPLFKAAETFIVTPPGESVRCLPLR